MKRNARKFIQRQESQPAKSQGPFFSSASRDLNSSGPAPFFQRQAQPGEKEQDQAVQKAAVDEDKNKVSKKEPDEDRKENTPVMTKSSR